MKVARVVDKQRSTCWSWLSENEKEHEGIIETTLPFDKRHRQFKHPLLCFSKMPKIKKVKMLPKKSDTDIEFFPSIEQARPILCSEDEDEIQQEFSGSIHQIDAFIREDDAGWDDNMSVVEMHEWLPPSYVSLQLLSNEKGIMVNLPSMKPWGMKTFEDDEASFDPVAFNPNSYDDNNIFRGNDDVSTSGPQDPNQEKENATTPSTVVESSYFSEKDELDLQVEDKCNLPSSDILLTEELNGLDIELGTFHSFDSFDFNDDSTEDAQYFGSDKLTEVFPHVVSPTCGHANNSDADELLSLPSFPSSSWDQDEDTRSEQGKESQDDTTDDIIVSCWKFGALFI